MKFRKGGTPIIQIWWQANRWQAKYNINRLATILLATVLLATIWRY
jgi:hypothetical protein